MGIIIIFTIIAFKSAPTIALAVTKFVPLVIAIINAMIIAAVVAIHIASNIAVAGAKIVVKLS